MIIGIEASSLADKNTGTGRYLSCILEQLKKTSDRVMIFNSPDGSDRKDPKSRIKKIWYRNYSVRKDIGRTGPDCIIFPDYYMPAGIDIQSAVIIHDLSFISHPQFYPKYFTAYYNYQIKRTLNQNPVIVTVSEHSRRNIVKYLGINEKNILIVQGYSKLHLNNNVNSATEKNGSPYLLYVGHIEPRKNLNFMVEGFLNWKKKTRSEFKLKIIGELWIRSKSTSALLDNYRSHPDVEFTGYVGDEDLTDAYSNASGFIHTSFEEGFGFPVLEAMHYRLPILCSGNTATGEISGPLSVKIDPSNDASYFEGLERLNELINRKKFINYDILYSPGQTAMQLEILLDRLGNRYSLPVNIPDAKTKTEALEKTLLYARMFNCGIKSDLLHRQIFDIKMSKAELKETVNESIRIGLAFKKGDHIFINYSWNKSFYANKNKIIGKKAGNLLRFLGKLPLTSMIAFSGGTNHYGIHNHDDIDIFIITKPNSVYIVYLIIHVFTYLIRSRKELCANYLIDENNLKILYQHDFYTAHQIISLRPFRNPQMLIKFWHENAWVKKFFPNFECSEPNGNFQASNFTLLKPVNLFLMKIYKRLYKAKINISKESGSLILEPDCLKLHTNDHRKNITIRFEKILGEYFNMKKQTDNRQFKRQVQIY